MGFVGYSSCVHMISEMKCSRVKAFALPAYIRWLYKMGDSMDICSFEHFPINKLSTVLLLLSLTFWVTVVGVGRYFLVRAGESEFESVGIINTNPVAKTSIDSGLSEKGKKQTLRAAFDLKAMGACENGCWVWPSITQRAYQGAEIIASVNRVSRRCVNLFSTKSLVQRKQ